MQTAINGNVNLKFRHNFSLFEPQIITWFITDSHTDWLLFLLYIPYWYNFSILTSSRWLVLTKLKGRLPSLFWILMMKFTLGKTNLMYWFQTANIHKKKIVSSLYKCNGTWTINLSITRTVECTCDVSFNVITVLHYWVDLPYFNHCRDQCRSIWNWLFLLHHNLCFTHLNMR
jgi:hypothetical protein